MPKLPFKGFEGSAHYRVAKDKFVLRYRLPDQDRFHEKASEHRASRNEKRAFLESYIPHLVSAISAPIERRSRGTQTTTSDLDPPLFLARRGQRRPRPGRGSTDTTHARTSHGHRCAVDSRLTSNSHPST